MKITAVHNSKNNGSKGFTLIEIIVSLAVFIVVAVIAVGAFLRILAANKQAEALETAMTNANFALDSMTRDLRVGYAYDCYDGTSNPPSSPVKTSCDPGKYTNPAIAFYSSQEPTGWPPSCPPPIHIYRFVPGTGSSQGVIQKAEQPDCHVAPTISLFVPLTSTTFNIQKFVIGVNAPAAPSPVQPKVFMSMSAVVGPTVQTQTSFSLQTTVSQRIMNGL